MVGRKNPDSKIKIVFTARQPFETVSEFFYEFMDLLNIERERVLIIDKPTQFDKIIVPEESVHSKEPFYTDEYKLVYDKMKKNVTPCNYEKIYISRTHFYKKDIINGEYFDNFYREKGYYIAQMDKYTIKEKIALMAGAKEVVATLGTDSHWTSFCNPGTKLVLLPRVDCVENAQMVTIKSAELDCYVVDISLSFIYEQFALWHCLVGPTKYWKNYVKDTYGYEITEDYTDTLKEKSYEYIANWLEYYLDPAIYNRPDVSLRSFDAFDIIKKMYQVFFDKELDDSKYNNGATKLQLKKQMADLNVYNSSSASQINALLSETSDLKQKNEELKLQLTALENTNKTLMSANSHLAQSVTEISSLLKNNTDSGE